jgi:hypothetical protein
MSCLDATFTLTPRSAYYYAAPYQYCDLLCYGADFDFIGSADFSWLYASDRFFFSDLTAADPSIDYAQWGKRMKVPFLEFGANLSGSGTEKQLALVFGFDAEVNGRVLVYTDAGLISGQVLAVTDHQFLLEIELPTPAQPLELYFIHAGGRWFFRGLSGYVV